MSRKIAVHTGSRADYSPLSNVIKLLGDNAIHIQTEGLYGHEAYFKSELERIRPDIAVILGDRFESLVFASVAALLSIPICHVHGGEETLGAVDNGFRHAITKLSYWHMAIHNDYAKRIIQMGEATERVFVTGAPGLDQYAKEDGVERIYSRRPLALVCYHPETLGGDRANLMRVGHEIGKVGSYMVSTSNADIGSDAIKDFWKIHGVEPRAYRQDEWISFMRDADVLIGNSSCFILEGMTLGKKVINIGDRQKGRYEEAIKHFAVERYPYGVPGEVSPKIVEILMNVEIPEKPRKEFHDLNY